MRNEIKKMSNYVTKHIKGQSSIFKSGEIIARGIIGASNSHPNPDIYIKEKITLYHNKITEECLFIGKCWSAIGCDVYRVNEFYNITDKLIQNAVDIDCLEEIEQDIELFIKYISVVFCLMGKLEQRASVKAKTTKASTTTLSSDERAKKVERVVQNLDDLFNVATKRKYDRLTADLAKYAIDRCKTGKDIYALATFLYRCKNITIVSKPNTITKWIDVFKSACENDSQTDNYKPNKVNPQIEDAMKYFTYLQI